MASTIGITYCGMYGEGATVKLAKQDAARKIETALDGSYTPSTFRIGAEVAFVYREPLGWGYVHLSSPDCTHSGYTTREDAIRYAVTHAAQNAWTHDVSDDVRFIAELPAITTEARRELVSYFAWQRRYKALRDAGHSDNDAHHMATSVVPA